MGSVEREMAQTIAAHFMTLIDEGKLNLETPGVEGKLVDAEYDQETGEVILVMAKDTTPEWPGRKAETVTKFFFLKVMTKEQG